jgi:hypothetical protein
MIMMQACYMQLCPRKGGKDFFQSGVLFSLNELLAFGSGDAEKINRKPREHSVTCVSTLFLVVAKQSVKQKW